jgi:hypothetical protein
MSPTVLAGQSYDLQDSPENIVLDFIKSRWNIEQDGFIPAKSDITFNLFGWAGRKSYQISVEPAEAPIVTRLSIGPEAYIQYNDPIVVHAWVLKNRDEVPPQLHHMTQKIEQIVLENVTNVGYGITGIQLIAPFSAIETREYFSQESGTQTSFQNPTEISLWHSEALVELLYFKVTYDTLKEVVRSKTHKYNIQV